MTTAARSRFAWNARATYSNRIRPPMSRARLNRRNLRRAATMLAKIILRVGLFGNYRRCFWRFALPALRGGHIDWLIAVGLVAHHMITFARECTDGRQNAAFYADRVKPAEKRRAAA